ncbi:hypothetical protein COB21_05805, partial [Candidatus Aerophobetes bacterium]
MRRFIYACLVLSTFAWGEQSVTLGVDHFFQGAHIKHLQGKNVGLISNHTGVNKDLVSTYALLKKYAPSCYTVKALFSPEHGWTGSAYAWEKVSSKKSGEVALYSLHGKTRRPTSAMLEGLDVLIFDIQDVGVRPYTYITTLFYAMEEASR